LANKNSQNDVSIQFCENLNIIQKYYGTQESHSRFDT